MKFHTFLSNQPKKFFQKKQKNRFTQKEIGAIIYSGVSGKEEEKHID